MKRKLLQVLTTALLVVINANTYCSDIKQSTSIIYCKNSEDPCVSRWDGTVEALKSQAESINFLVNNSTDSLDKQYDVKILNEHINNFCEFLATNFENLLSKGETFEVSFINIILSKMQENDNRNMFIEILKDKLSKKWKNMAEQNHKHSDKNIVDLFINLLSNNK